MNRPKIDPPVIRIESGTKQIAQNINQRKNAKKKRQPPPNRRKEPRVRCFAFACLLGFSSLYQVLRPNLNVSGRNRRVGLAPPFMLYLVRQLKVVEVEYCFLCGVAGEAYPG